jgi:hypothetical protein
VASGEDYANEIQTEKLIETPLPKCCERNNVRHQVYVVEANGKDNSEEEDLGLGDAEHQGCAG